MKVKKVTKAVIDYSNTKDGYVMVKFTGQTNKKLKAQVKGPTTTYTYNVTPGVWEVFPVSDGNGKYRVAVFENGKGRTADAYKNKFGGAIYCPYDYYYTSVVNLNNCTFKNNTAEYGGAIYMDNGYLTIIDSHFINNTAYNYGGAIALEYNIRAIINNTEFIGDKSTNDAGGAIYLRCSPISGSDLKFKNCEATFGAGLTSLNSTVNLELIDGEGNVAKYNGGVIYHMYGSFSLKDSSFTNNSACSGGALFIDNSTSFYLLNSVFTNNKASVSAGAVYSLLNNLL